MIKLVFSNFIFEHVWRGVVGSNLHPLCPSKWLVRQHLSAVYKERKTDFSDFLKYASANAYPNY